jgi:hypothetical protein
MTIKGRTIVLTEQDIKEARLGEYGKASLISALEMAGYESIIEGTISHKS